MSAVPHADEGAPVALPRAAAGFAPVRTGAARYWYMDSLRAALMIGGVFYHAALVYAPTWAWRVRDPSDIAAFGWLAELLSAFRMPAFFFIAGFFCSFVFGRGRPAAVLRRRLLVLGLPLLTMAVTLQPLQYALKLVGHDQPLPGGVLEFIASYLAAGGFISHLWFLVNLLVYHVFAAAWLIHGGAWHGRVQRLLDNPRLLGLARHKLPWALGCSVVILAVDHTAGLWGLGTQYDLGVAVRYVPFFVAGAIAYSRPAWLEALLHVSVLDGVAAAVLVADAWWRPPGEPVPGIVSEMQFYLWAFVGTACVVRLFRALLDRRSALQQRLVDAAFSIYLFHHLCVIATAMALLAWAPALHPLIKYGLVVAVGCGVPYAVHAGVLCRVPWLRLLFNGRRQGSGG